MPKSFTEKVSTIGLQILQKSAPIEKLIKRSDYTKIINMKPNDEKNTITQMITPIIKSKTLSKNMKIQNKYIDAGLNLPPKKKTRLRDQNQDISFTYIKKVLTIKEEMKIKNLLKQNFIFDEIPDEIVNSLVREGHILIRHW